jgi:hypothetical protein
MNAYSKITRLKNPKLLCDTVVFNTMTTIIGLCRGCAIFEFQSPKLHTPSQS